MRQMTAACFSPMICLGNDNIMNLYIKVFQQLLPLGVLINDFYDWNIKAPFLLDEQQRVKKNPKKIWLPKLSQRGVGGVVGGMPLKSHWHYHGLLNITFICKFKVRLQDLVDGSVTNKQKNSLTPIWQIKWNSKNIYFHKRGNLFITKRKKKGCCCTNAKAWRGGEREAAVWRQNHSWWQQLLSNRIPRGPRVSLYLAFCWGAAVGRGVGCGGEMEPDKLR